MFRSAAITVANSIHKGQPVTVHGRFRTAEWEGDGGTRVDLVIDATSVGHDLTRGTAEFTRAYGDAALAVDDPEAPDADVEAAETQAEPTEAEESVEGAGAAEDEEQATVELALTA